MIGAASQVLAFDGTITVAKIVALVIIALMFVAGIAGKTVRTTTSSERAVIILLLALAVLVFYA